MTTEEALPVSAPVVKKKKKKPARAAKTVSPNSTHIHISVAPVHEVHVGGGPAEGGNSADRSLRRMKVPPYKTFD